MYPAYGVPQALAWNIGTIISSRSLSFAPIAAADVTAIEWSTVDRWL